MISKKVYYIFINTITLVCILVSTRRAICMKTSIRDPFSDKTSIEKKMTLRQSKRTQRYRSTAKSRILGMTVGDIRYCFQQLRAAGDSLTPYFILYNGLYAGEFTLMYLIETSNSMKKRRRRKKYEEDGEFTTEEDEVDTLPDSQLIPKRMRSDDGYSIRSMEF